MRRFVALAAGRSRSEAAAAAGVEEAVLEGWLGGPQFRAALRAERAVASDALLSTLNSNVLQAVVTLHAVAADPGSPAWARAAACRTLLRSARPAAYIDTVAAEAEIAEDLYMALLRPPRPRPN